MNGHFFDAYKKDIGIRRGEEVKNGTIGSFKKIKTPQKGVKLKFHWQT